MRHSGPAKQRVWLGPGRYICGCEWRITHANAYSYSYSDGDSHSYGHLHRNGIADSHATTDPNTQSGAISKAASHASSQALEFPDGKFLMIGDRRR